jgi:hypothetical protein
VSSGASARRCTTGSARNSRDCRSRCRPCESREARMGRSRPRTAAACGARRQLHPGSAPHRPRALAAERRGRQPRSGARGLARRSSLSGTAVRFRRASRHPISIGMEARNHLFRIAQEAVQNALKHAGGTAIEIELSGNAAGSGSSFWTTAAACRRSDARPRSRHAHDAIPGPIDRRAAARRAAEAGGKPGRLRPAAIDRAARERVSGLRIDP